MAKPADKLKVTLGAALVVPLDLLLEPELPARESMNDEKMAELVESMAQVGQLFPLLVVPHAFWSDGSGQLAKEKPEGKPSSATTRYEIIDGHRRFIAARELRWQAMRVEIYERKDVAMEAARAHANLVREDMNAAEEAVWYRQLIDLHALDEEGLCKLVLRKPDYIGDRMRLLRGDPEIFQCVRDGRIRFGVARELNKITDQGMRRYYLDCAMRGGHAQHIVASWVKDWKTQQVLIPQSAPAAPVNGDQAAIEPYHMECFTCGGDKDPWNLVNVYIHKWELEEIKKVLAQSNAGEAK